MSCASAFYISQNDKHVLRELAQRVAEIAASPYHAVRREMWKKHNSLQKVKPMVLVFPEGAWKELLPDHALVTSTPFARKWERHLRHLIYRWEHLRDDNVIEPVIKVPLVYTHSGWGLTPSRRKSPIERGAWAYEPSMKSEEDFNELQFPKIEIDEEQTHQQYQALAEAIGDILTVKIHRRVGVDTSIIGTLADLRGLDQLMIDLLDRPQWVHEVLEFLTQGTEHLLDYVEQEGVLVLNNGDDYVGSGGVGYTDELPAPGFDGTHVRLRDLWGFAEAQEFVAVSPAMHQEFALNYQIRLLRRFGLNCYGCCEPLTDCLEYVKKVPRLRRISISPWADLSVAAESLQNKYILSWKPNPTEMVSNGFDPQRIRSKLTEAVQIARDCVLEIILKDTHTVNNQPHRFDEWVRIAQEVTAAG